MPASRRDTTILLEENYETLRRRAHRLIDRERRFLTLPPTDYLHQAYLRTRKRGVRLSELSPIGFIRYLTREMRWVRADHVRHRLGSKRGGGSAHVSIEELSLTALGGLTSVNDRVDVRRALNHLSARSTQGPRMVRALELRASGFSLGEIANQLEVSRGTVTTDLECATLWLRQHLAPKP